VIHNRERKALIHKLRYRGGDREGDIDQRKEGIHPQAQVKGRRQKGKYRRERGRHSSTSLDIEGEIEREI